MRLELSQYLSPLPILEHSDLTVSVPRDPANAWLRGVMLSGFQDGARRAQARQSR